MKVHSEKHRETYTEGQYHYSNSKGSGIKTDLESTNKILESTRGNNRANQAYGKGDTFTSREVALARIGQARYESDTLQAGGGVAFLEARARTYGDKTSRGAEAQASLVRVEYGVKYDQSLVTVGSKDAELVGVGARGNVEGFLGAQTKAEAGIATKKGIPYAYAGAYAFAGARASASGAVEGRVAGVSVGAEGNGYAWAGAQAGAEGSVSPTGAKAEAGAFAGAKAGVEGEIAIFGVGIGGSAEASAGIGAEAGFTAGFHDGELAVGFDAGAALGVGVGYGVDVSIDLETMARDAQNVADAAGGVLEEAAEAGGEAVEAVGEAVGGAAEATGDAAGDVWDGIGDATGWW